MSETQATNGAANGTAAGTLWQRLTIKQVIMGTLLVALIVLGFALLVSLREVFILLFLGIVVATALNPVVERLRRYNIPQGAAVLIAFTLFILVVAGIVAALVPFFLAQATQAATDLPGLYASLRNDIANSSSSLIRGLAAQMPSDPFSSLSTEDGIALGTSVATALPSFGRGLLMGAMVLLMCYYWLYYRAFSIQSAALLVPIDRRAGAVELWSQIEAKIGGFMRGLAILCLTVGLASGIGYMLIGLPYGLPIAIIGGLLEAIPYAGPFLTMALAIMVGLSVSKEMALLALLVGIVVQFIESTIIVPRVMDRAVGVRPVVTLLALAIFELLFGMLGAVLAVPLAAVFQVLLDRFMLGTPAPENLDIGGRDKLALLRYQTQDLASDLRQQVRSKTVEIDDEVDAAEEELEGLLTDLDGLLAAAQEQRS
jgi:predicted PurR-regulated permease PerM